MTAVRGWFYASCRWRRLAAAAIVALAVAARPSAAQDARGAVSGSVSVADANGNPIPMPGVTVTLTCPGAEPRTEVSNDRGTFDFVDVTATAARCSVVAELGGFTSAAATVAVSSEPAPVDLRLGLDTLREEVTVRGALGPTGVETHAAVERLALAEMQSAPIASDRFQDALPLIPGVVRGPDGLLSIAGARSNQTAMTFNSANGTDPVTGEEAIDIPIDAVSSVQVQGAAYAPEFGLSAGAVTLVETQRGGESWDVTLNDLEPRVRRRGGEFRGIESWTPRVTAGGPVVKGKFSLLESIQYEYSQTRVFGLPAFESDTEVQSLESFTRGDWTLDSANHVAVSSVLSPRETTYAGLNTFNPQPVTPDVKNFNVFVTGSDQVVVRENAVLESRVSVKRFDSTIGPSQGSAPMVLAPDVNSGSYFNDQDRTSWRVDAFAAYSFAPWGPAHLLKAGTGLGVETFAGTNRSREVDIVRENGTLSQRITFAGSGALDRRKTAFRAYAQDTWTASPRLSVQYGGRLDFESIAHRANVAPRTSITLAATGDARTVVRAGAGVFYSSVPLNVAAFDELQSRVVTTFAGDGVTPIVRSALVNARPSALDAPRSVNWNVELDRELAANFYVRAGYRERQNRDEAVVDIDAASIVLRTDGSSRYREGQVTARYQFRASDQIVASYTESSARGNLNEFNRFFGNIEDPIIRPDEVGPLPWDAPHRVLVWANVSLPHGFAIFPVVDARSGFPLSNVDADRDFVGPRNAVGRFPAFVSLDAQVTKKLRLFGHNATLGLKVFNITNHFNPRDYQGNLASAEFGGFANSVGRTFRGKWIFEF